MISYANNPRAIEVQSLDLIAQVLASYALASELFPVALRVVHATADFSLAPLLAVHNITISGLANLFRSGGPVFCDVAMVAAGISRPCLQERHLEPRVWIHDDTVARSAECQGITRAMAAVDRAVAEGVTLFAFGNAPTGVFRLLEHFRQGAPVRGVVGVPVGFVGAAESKELLGASGIPCLILRGPRGGSTICAAALNALLRSDDGVPSSER